MDLYRQERVTIEELYEQGKAAVSGRPLPEQVARALGAQVSQRPAAQRPFGDAADVLGMCTDLPRLAVRLRRRKPLAEDRLQTPVSPDHRTQIRLKDKRLHRLHRDFMASCWRMKSKARRCASATSFLSPPASPCSASGTVTNSCDTPCR